MYRVRNYKRPWKGDEGIEFRALVLHTYARNGLLSSREDRNVKNKGRHNPSKNSIINPYQGAQKKFLVLWKGWPIQDASWVAQKDLTPYLLKYGFRTSFYVVRESFL